mgnify:CR=1 FL=1
MNFSLNDCIPTLDGAIVIADQQIKGKGRFFLNFLNKFQFWLVKKKIMQQRFDFTSCRFIFNLEESNFAKRIQCFKLI